MSFFEAYAAADGAGHWTGDILARLQDFLGRRVAPVGEKLEGVLRRADGAFSAVRVRAFLRSLSEKLTARQRKSSGETSSPSDPLAAYFARICEADKGKTIDDYAVHLSGRLVTFDFDF